MTQENSSLRRNSVWHTTKGYFNIPRDINLLFGNFTSELDIRKEITRLFNSSKNTARLFKSIKPYLKYLDLYKYSDDKELISSMINSKNLIGKRIYARNTSISFIKGSPEEFYNNNHLQGSCLSTFSCILTLNCEIVQAASFLISSTSALLVRNATLKNHLVVGGFQRILKHSIERLKSSGILEIQTFANGDFTLSEDDNVYTRNGFTFQYDTKGTLWYLPKEDVFIKNELLFEKNKLINRQRLMKSKLERFNGMTSNGKMFIYDPSLTEKDNLESVGIIQYFSKACYKYIYKIS